MFDFPSNPVLNQNVNGPNSSIYTWDGVKWVVLSGHGGGGGSGGGGGVSEAPQDGGYYLRRNAAWTEVADAGTY